MYPFNIGFGHRAQTRCLCSLGEIKEISNFKDVWQAQVPNDYDQSFQGTNRLLPLGGSTNSPQAAG